MKKFIFSALLLISLSSYAQTSVGVGAGWNTDHYSVLEANLRHDFKHFTLKGGVYTPFSDSKSKETLWHIQVGREICLNRDLSLVPAVGYGHSSNDYVDRSSFVASTYLYAHVRRRMDVFGGFIYAGKPSYAIFSGGIAYTFNERNHPYKGKNDIYRKHRSHKNRYDND